MKAIFFKNISSTDLFVNDLGIQISPGEDIDLATNFDEEQVLQSVDLQEAIENQGLILLEGTTQLSYQDLVDYLTDLNRYDKIDFAYIASKDDSTDITGTELERLTNGSDVSSLHTHDVRYFSKTQLSTPGQASVEYSNIINIPNFYWKQPVQTVGNLPTTDNSIGDVRLVISLKSIYTWDGSYWVNLSKAINISIDPISGYTSENVQQILEAIKAELTAIENGSQHVTKSLDDAYGDGSVINVDTADLEINLDVNKKFSIDSSIDNTSIIEASNTSILLSSKGSFELKDSNMTNTISLSQQNQGGLNGFVATSLIGALNELKASQENSTVSLQGAYDNGRSINVSNKAVSLLYSSYAPLQIQNVSSSPSLDLQDGQIAIIQGDLCTFDISRMKWESVAEMLYVWSDQSCSGKYMRVGVSMDAMTGYVIPKNCVITKISAKIASGNQSKEFQIRKNNVSIKNFNLSNGIFFSNIEDISLVAGDVLQMYCSGYGTPVQDPIISLFIKWRY